MLFTNDVEPVTSSSDPAQPGVRELGRPRPGNGHYSVSPIDGSLQNETGGQNDEGDPIGGGGRVANVGTKG